MRNTHRLLGPVDWAPADPKIGEREVLAAMLEVEADLIKNRPGLPLITDKGFASKPFERSLSAKGITLLCPSRKREVLRAGEPTGTTSRPGRRSVVH